MSPVKPKLVEADASPQHAVKAKLVDAIRMLERADIIDHNGHCSARRDATSFHINSGASVRGALTVDDIVSVDLAVILDAVRNVLTSRPFQEDLPFSSRYSLTFPMARRTPGRRQHRQSHRKAGT